MKSWENFAISLSIGFPVYNYRNNLNSCLKYHCVVKEMKCMRRTWHKDEDVVSAQAMLVYLLFLLISLLLLLFLLSVFSFNFESNKMVVYSSLQHWTFAFLLYVSNLSLMNNKTWNFKYQPVSETQSGWFFK